MAVASWVVLARVRVGWPGCASWWSGLARSTSGVGLDMGKYKVWLKT
jgi:hypothetical protein